MSNTSKIRVMIVDDSAFMRVAIERMLRKDDSIEIIGSASNGREAIEKAVRLKPSVITMDVEMPIMDGLQALKEIMKISPTPVIMVSSLTKIGAKTALDALELGAIDYIPKPGSLLSTGVLSLQDELLRKIHIAANSKPSGIKLVFSAVKKLEKSAPVFTDENIISAVFIGASTGGPPAIQTVLSTISPSFPAPIVIAQHMPKIFTAAFASRLNVMCAIKVKEACDGEALQKSMAYICPGDYQTRIFKDIDGKYKFVMCPNTIEKDCFAPCINTLFFSAAREFSHRTIGVILTGMGEDGVRGLKNIKLMGGLTIAQDRASSVVYGMPRAALEQEAASRILSLGEIAKEISIALK